MVLLLPNHELGIQLDVGGPDRHRAGLAALAALLQGPRCEVYQPAGGERRGAGDELRGKPQLEGT